MNKSDFLKQLSLNCNLPEKICRQVLSNSYLLLCDCLNKGEEVNFYGFGKFYVKTRQERFYKQIGVNTLALLPPQNVPVFKTGRVFKQIIK